MATPIAIEPTRRCVIMANNTINSRIPSNDQLDPLVDTQVAEVVTSYARSVLDVAHVGQTRSRQRSSIPLMAFGGALMLGGLGLFGYEITQPWAAYNAEVVEAQQLHREAPPPPGLGTGSLGMLLALLGLVPFVAGGMRRRDTGLDAYLIGEGSEARFKVRGADLPDPAATALVSRIDGGFALAFTASMQGSVELGEQSISLTDLVASGRARASDGAYHYPLPSGAKAKVMHGDVRFDIRLVDRGSIVAGRGDVDWPFWSYFGGTATVGAAFFLLMRSMPSDALAMQIADNEASARFASYFHQADERAQDEPVMVDEDPEAPSTDKRPRIAETTKPTSSTKSMPGDREVNPRSISDASTARGPRAAVPSLDRGWNPADAAQRAGIFSVLDPQDRRFIASAGGFTLATDDAQVWANTGGIDHSVGGLEATGSSRGGGLADGAIGMDDHGMLGHGDGSSGLRIHRGGNSASKFEERTPQAPSVRIVKGDTVSGDIDKEVIRRIVRQHLNEVRSCYNQALSRNPNLEGRVVVQFTITDVGSVPKAIVQENATKDSSVARCIADAVERWTFPRGGKSGIALVSYPFMLSRG
jgi:hypothetical protein